MGTRPSSSTSELEDVRPGETELERRLRDLQWPEPPPDSRERVLAALRARLDAAQSGAPEPWYARRAS
jgi:hypothetical protein